MAKKKTKKIKKTKKRSKLGLVNLKKQLEKK